MSTKQPLFTMRIDEQERAELEALKTLYRTRSKADAVRQAVRNALTAAAIPTK